ncbi:hypothetical protein JCM8097_006410 [Rhodosporidiobolus ruineniae]
MLDRGTMSDESHHVFSSAGFGYSTTSLASRAPTFVSSRSGFSDESSLHTSARSESHHGHNTIEARQPPSIPIRPPLLRRRSSTGSIGEKNASPQPLSSSLPSPSHTAVFSRRPSAPFANLILVSDADSNSRRAPLTEPVGRDSLLPPETAAHQEKPAPPQKLKRKASMTVRGRYGGVGSSSVEELAVRPPPRSAGIAPPSPNPPRRSVSSRPSFCTSHSGTSITTDSLSVPPVPSPSSRPSSRARSRTQTAADVDGGKSSSGFRGGFVKLKKSTSSLRSAFRLSRQESVPPVPSLPLPPTPPPLPVLTPRSAVARGESVERLMSGLERAEAPPNLRRRASERSPSSQRQPARPSEDIPVDGFSFAATASASPSPHTSPRPAARRRQSSPSSSRPTTPAPPVPSRSPSRPSSGHGRSKSRPPSTSPSPESSSGSSTRLRRSASTGADGRKPRRPAPPLPALVARLEATCAKADAALAVVAAPAS